MGDIKLDCYAKLMHLCWKMKKQSRKNLANYGFAWNQYTVLKNIFPNESITLSELSSRTFKDSSNLTSLVDFLEKKDLIIRTTDSRDRRSIRVELTAYGAKVRENTIKQHEDFIKSMFVNMNEDEIKDFIQFLDIADSKINL